MKVKKAYALWAQQYDHNLNKTRDLDKQVTIQTLEKYSFDTVLELGCGTGKNTIWLEQNAQHITAMDFSAEMLQLAKQKIKTDKVVFIEQNLLEEWNLPKKQFDLITCSLTLEHIKDLGLIFAKAYERLKENALFFISELHPFKQYLGSKARFEMGTETVEIEVYTHHITDYLKAAKASKFKLIALEEWFDSEVPRLASFVFQK